MNTGYTAQPGRLKPVTEHFRPYRICRKRPLAALLSPQLPVDFVGCVTPGERREDIRRIFDASSTSSACRSRLWRFYKKALLTPSLLFLLCFQYTLYAAKKANFPQKAKNSGLSGKTAELPSPEKPRKYPYTNSRKTAVK